MSITLFFLTLRMCCLNFDLEKNQILDVITKFEGALPNGNVIPACSWP